MVRRTFPLTTWVAFAAWGFAACVSTLDTGAETSTTSDDAGTKPPMAGTSLPMPVDPCSVGWRFDSEGRPIQVPADCSRLTLPDDPPNLEPHWDERVGRPMMGAERR